MHHIQVLSSDFSRDLSHSVKILPDAQGHNDAHGTRAAELPGICNVNFVSDRMGDGISPSAWSRGVSKPEKPTQGAPARADISNFTSHVIRRKNDVIRHFWAGYQ